MLLVLLLLLPRYLTLVLFHDDVYVVVGSLGVPGRFPRVVSETCGRRVNVIVDQCECRAGNNTTTGILCSLHYWSFYHKEDSMLAY